MTDMNDIHPGHTIFLESKMNCEYEIVVNRKQTVERNERDWKCIADSGNEKDDGRIYGYVDDVREVEEDREMYRQTVTGLNFAELVRLLNPEEPT